ncbi:MAG: recombination-associated protein RdgC [Kiritimatiellaeota bacterium]|nr:recombination-associated protein RdgC [Kiritimatiellota bacterium]
MGFESGSVSLRLFHLPQPLPERVVPRFARHALPPLDTLGAGKVVGWVSGRHLLDRQLTDANALYGGYLRLTLVAAERKIPAALFRAECKLEELAQLAAGGQDRLSARARSDIRQQVTARLLPQMPPQLKAIPFVSEPAGARLWAAALADKQTDEFLLHFHQATGLSPIPLTPEAAAARRQVDVRQWDVSCFSSEAAGEPVSDRAGHDFLTWFWFISEARGGMAAVPGLGSFGLLLEGPLTFVMEGGGAHEVILRKGEPRLSAEAKAALVSGKKLKRAKITLTRGDQTWTCALDAENFVFRGLRLPTTEQVDAVSRFQDRLRQIELFQDAFLGIYDQFLAERNDAARWENTLLEIRRWVADRATRR